MQTIMYYAMGILLLTVILVIEVGMLAIVGHIIRDMWRNR